MSAYFFTERREGEQLAVVRSEQGDTSSSPPSTPSSAILLTAPGGVTGPIARRRAAPTWHPAAY